MFSLVTSLRYGLFYPLSVVEVLIIKYLYMQSGTLGKVPRENSMYQSQTIEWGQQPSRLQLHTYLSSTSSDLWHLAIIWYILLYM